VLELAAAEVRGGRAMHGWLALTTAASCLVPLHLYYNNAGQQLLIVCDLVKLIPILRNVLVSRAQIDAWPGSLCSSPVHADCCCCVILSNLSTGSCSTALPKTTSTTRNKPGRPCVTLCKCEHALKANCCCCCNCDTSPSWQLLILQPSVTTVHSQGEACQAVSAEALC
jgi:hypothetical protein